MSAAEPKALHHRLIVVNVKPATAASNRHPDSRSSTTVSKHSRSSGGGGHIPLVDILTRPNAAPLMSVTAIGLAQAMHIMIAFMDR